MAEDCNHKDFAANVVVSRLEDIGGFAADVTVWCAHCKIPFQFLGLPGGLSPNRGTVSFDQLEARLPIAPMTSIARND